MKKTPKALIFFGYVFSIAGGIIGVPIALILTGSKDEESKNHGRMMLFTALASVISFSIIFDDLLMPMLSEIFLFYTITYSIIGGIAAHLKKDFFSRGFCISMFTGIFGVVVLLYCPNSKAKEGNENDYHNWPENGALALVLFITLLIFLFICKSSIY